VRRGLGGLYLRGSIYWYHFSVNGRVVRESTGCTDPNEAMQVYLRARIRHGLVVPAADIRFSDLQQILEDDYSLNRRRSARRMKSAFKNVAAIFGQARASQITAARLSAYAKLRDEDGVAPATIVYELALLRRAMKLARRSALIETVPAFPTIAVHNVRAGFTEDETYDAILDKLAPRARPTIEFLFWTGWRLGDAVKLRWDQVDRKHGTIVLERGTTKNKAGRVLPYRALPELDAIIEGEWALRDPADERVFRLGERTLRDYWNEARVAAKVPSALLHDFRRTAARRYVRKGINEKVAMQLLGMKTRSIFDRYNIVSEVDMANALRRVSPVVAQQSHNEEPNDKG
jgi:integrase